MQAGLSRHCSLQFSAEPDVRGIVLVCAMPLKHFDHRWNVDWHSQQLDGQEARVLTGQSSGHCRDALGANYQFRGEIETGSDDLNGSFVMAASEDALVVVHGTTLVHVDGNMSQLEVLLHRNR